MKKRIWTNEQLKAISHPVSSDGDAKPALVSAAAGSGKTAVLVERVIRLLTMEENPVLANRIALVTFTKKAAEEMRTRLVNALNSLPNSLIIRRQQILLEEARISTINSFCLSLLRENSGVSGLSVGFTVGDEGLLELVKKEAMSKTLEQFYELSEFSPDEIERACMFFGTNGDRGIRTAVGELYDFTQTIPDSEEWLLNIEEMFSDPKRYYDEIVPFYYDMVKNDIERAIGLINKGKENASCAKTINSLDNELCFFEEYYDDFECNAEYPKRRETDKSEGDDTKAFLKDIRTETKKIKDKVILASELIMTFEEAVQKLYPIVKTIIKLYKIYYENYLSLKRKNNVVDFPDTEQLCLKLLRENKSILERIRNEYDLIIVDEFQDSNFLQYEIFRLIDGDKGKLFLVGDLKQSIYRFRGADSAVFEEVLGSPLYKVIHLSRNFRSGKGVIDGVNDIFDDVMPHYGEDSRLKLPENKIAGSGEEYKTELCLIGAGDYPDLEPLAAEATYTALRIKQMVLEEFKVFDKGGEYRSCDYADFAVISSTGDKNFRVYEKVFREYGVPCVSSGTKGYLKAEEIGIALDLLTVIDNPYNDLSLFNVLMSPLFSFSAEMIAKCRAGRKDIPLYSAIIKSGIDKAVSFEKTISRYRRVADIAPVSELVAIIDSNGGFLPLAFDSHRQANIRLLIYYAEQFSQIGRDCSLSAFLKFIKEIDTAGIDIKQASAAPDSIGCVRFMTIHGSKGLEFPVCFVSRMNQRFNLAEQGSGRGRDAKPRSLVRYDKKVGFVVDYFSSENFCRFKTLFSDYFSRLNHQSIIDEELRKLYVGATRAECKLIFTGYSKKKCSKVERDELGGLIEKNSYLGFMAKNNKIAITEPIRIPEDGDVDKLNKDLRESEKNKELNKEEVSKINKALKLYYPREILGSIPKKMTATQVGVAFSDIEANAYDEPSVFPRNPSFHGIRRLTGKKRGDAYHKMMELIDFSKGEYDLQFNSLRDRFTQIEFDAISFKEIEGFFKSELGIRAIKSEKVVKEYELYTEIGLEYIINDANGLPDDYPRPFIQGIADMYFYENGEIVLVDYKTNRNTTAEKLIYDYKGQLSIYKKAIEEMTGDVVKECFIYSFEKGAIMV